MALCNKDAIPSFCTYAVIQVGVFKASTSIAKSTMFGSFLYLFSKLAVYECLTQYTEFIFIQYQLFTFFF